MAEAEFRGAAADSRRSGALEGTGPDRQLDRSRPRRLLRRPRKSDAAAASGARRGLSEGPGIPGIVAGRVCRPPGVAQLMVDTRGIAGGRGPPDALRGSG